MADTKLPAYLPYPRFLLKMEISQTAKLLYALLLDRSTLSQKNKWQDGLTAANTAAWRSGKSPFSAGNGGRADR